MATHREHHRHSSVARPRDQLIMAQQHRLNRFDVSSVRSSSAADAKRSTPGMDPRIEATSSVTTDFRVPMDSRRPRKFKEPNDLKASSSSRPDSGRRRRSDGGPRSRDRAMLGAQLDMLSTQRPPERRRSHLPAAYVAAPRQAHRFDEDLTSIGSWSYNFTERGKPAPAWSDCPPEAPFPPSAPRIPRLPTPELGPLATDFEFCHCHGDEACEDRINEVWYLSSRARVDSQVDAALAHIARAKLEHAAWE